MQALTAIAVLPVVWINLPTDAKAMIPDAAEPWAFTVLAVAGVVGRLVNQGGE